jgi:hypothetical protein
LNFSILNQHYEKKIYNFTFRLKFIQLANFNLDNECNA